MRRFAELGITDFETVNDVERQQDDMLRRLAESSSDPGRYAGVPDCRPNFCGRRKCAEACWFGARRRRLEQIPLVYDLLQNGERPLHEMRIIRSVWVQPFGQLDRVSIGAANRLNRRALDEVFIPSMVAVGTFKVSAASKYQGNLWICEIHQIVAGAEREDLERVYGIGRRSANWTNFVWVKEIENLGQAVSNVLRQDLEGWQNPYHEPDPWRPKKEQRNEFYAWLLDLSPAARMIRYGCDRYFNKLEKKPRTFQPKVPKGHPYPRWLEPYMYGNHPQRCMCRVCSPHLYWKR